MTWCGRVRFCLPSPHMFYRMAKSSILFIFNVNQPLFIHLYHLIDTENKIPLRDIFRNRSFNLQPTRTPTLISQN